MSKIEIIRGDTKTLKFQRINKSTKEVITEKPDEMYMTIKSSYKNEDYVIQKRLSDDSISFNIEDYFYYVTLEPKDTNDLEFGDYDFDIEVIEEENKKTILVGEITILKEVTWEANEV